MNFYIGFGMVFFLVIVFWKMIDLHQEAEVLRRRLVMSKELIEMLNGKSFEEHKLALKYKSALLSITNMLDRTGKSASVEDAEQTTGVSLFMSTIESCKRLAEYAVDDKEEGDILHETGEN